MVTLLLGNGTDSARERQSLGEGREVEASFKPLDPVPLDERPLGSLGTKLARLLGRHRGSSPPTGFALHAHEFGHLRLFSPGTDLSLG